jgi:hypothetical protein
MQGHVARKRDRYYAVIYEGLDPVTGKEHRSWHPAGTDRAEAAALVARLAAERDGRNDEVRSLTFGAYLTHHWLPAKRLELRVSTHRSYVHKTQRHILPTLGRRSGSAGCGPRTSNGSTTRCCTPPTAPGPSPRRPSTRCT